MRPLQGLYLVLDTSLEVSVLLQKLGDALAGGVDIVQIWNNWPEDFQEQDKIATIKKIQQLIEPYQVPLIIHEDWSLALKTKAAGIHFDTLPDKWSEMKEKLSDYLIGFTVGNEIEKIEWAIAENVAYLSFCAMFPSSSVDSCDIVSPETVLFAGELTDIPLFLSGGITPEKLDQLGHLTYKGVAVISGILNTYSPTKAAESYKEALVKNKII